jgi:hypothetical protein
MDMERLPEPVFRFGHVLGVRLCPVLELDIAAAANARQRPQPFELFVEVVLATYLANELAIWLVVVVRDRSFLAQCDLQLALFWRVSGPGADTHAHQTTVKCLIFDKIRGRVS